MLGGWRLSSVEKYYKHGDRNTRRASSGDKESLLEKRMVFRTQSKNGHLASMHRPGGSWTRAKVNERMTLVFLYLVCYYQPLCTKFLFQTPIRDQFAKSKYYGWMCPTPKPRLPLHGKIMALPCTCGTCSVRWLQSMALACTVVLPYSPVKLFLMD